MLSYTLHPSGCLFVGCVHSPQSRTTRTLLGRIHLPPRRSLNDLCIVIVKHPQNRHPRSGRRSCSHGGLSAPGFDHPVPAHVAHAVPGKHENNPYSDYISHVFWPSRSLRLCCPARHTTRPSDKYDRTNRAQRLINQIKQSNNQQRAATKSHNQTTA